MKQNVFKYQITKSPKKGLMNIKNKDRKCFLWCHVRHINLVELQKKIKKLVRHIIISVKIHPERITKKGKKSVNDLDYDGIEFPVQKKILARLKKGTIFALMSFVTKMGCPFQFTFQIKNFKTR